MIDEYKIFSVTELGFFEKIFIHNGYVLDFTNATFESFVMECIGINVYTEDYKRNVKNQFGLYGNPSKGYILKYIFKNENPNKIFKLINELIEYCEINRHLAFSDDFPSETSILKAKEILKKYNSHDDVLDFSSSESRIIDLINEINKIIENGDYIFAIDRLHTLTQNILRNLCIVHGLEYKKDGNLHDLIREYFKFIKENNYIESAMSKSLLKGIASIFQKFDEVRNHNSYAHDNYVLGNAESLFIFRQVVNILKFIEDIDDEFSLNQIS